MSNPKETKELQVKQDAGALAALQEAFAPSENPGLTAQDILISKILLMQFMSDAVTEGRAEAGELRDSVTDELIGSFKAPVKIIPFHLTKTFIEYEEVVGAKGKVEKNFLRVVPIDANPLSKGFNDDLPYNEKVDGKHISRDRTINIYCLDPNNPQLPPRIIGFRRSSLKAGKQLATGMYVRNATAKLPPFAYVWELGARLESNDQGKFYVFEAKSTEELISADLIPSVKYWLKQIGSRVIKEDHSDISKEKAVKSEVDDVDSGTF